MLKKVFIITTLSLLFLPLVVSADSSGKSLTAYNQTQGVNAELARANFGDTIVYTLTYANSSSASQSYTIEDDITDVLYASALVNPGGATLIGSTLRYPAVSVPAWGSVQRTFSVQIKSLPAKTLDTLMSNTFGNGVDIKINVPGVLGTVKGAYVAPSTGPGENLALWFALVTCAGFYLRKKVFYNKVEKQAAV